MIGAQMSQDRHLAPQQVVAVLRRHPRVAFQQLVEKPDDLARLQGSLPELVPFGGAHYEGVLPMVDWDHRLPSRSVVLRIYAYYSESTLRAGLTELTARSQQIAAQDRYPEFDVADFAGLAADEAYEAELDQQGTVAKIRLVSAWRRRAARTRARSSASANGLVT